MRHYALAFIAIAGVLLAAFGVVEAVGVPLLSDPQPWLDAGGGVAAATGVSLLVMDVILPVPSSVVMMAHGALFGVLAGAVLSLLGGTGALLLGFAVGRRGGPLLHRSISADERARAEALLERWGTLAILVTRPIPILAEATAIMAGASRMPWTRALAAGILGSLPAAVLFALAGAVARSYGNLALIFGVLLAIAAVVWLVGHWLQRGLAQPVDAP